MSVSVESTISIGLFLGLFSFIFIFATILVIAFVIIKNISSKTKDKQENEGSFNAYRYGENQQTAQPPKPKNTEKPKINREQIKKLEEEIKKLCKNSVALDISGEAEYIKGGTRFGGKPDVPADFGWPYFETDAFDDTEVKPRPLAFLAQFDLSEISKYDTEGLLPRSGTLAFFYELGSQRWGFDPRDKGCARVYWFHEWEDLSPADFPEDLDEDYRLPMLEIKPDQDFSYPDGEDFYLNRNDYGQTVDEYEAALLNLGADKDDNISKLLGWADVIQGNMTSECELVSRGYTSDEVWNGDNFPAEELKKIEKAADGWTLLFQLDTVSHEDFELMFGDAGRIYFYIRKDDLKAKRFDRVWLVLQCG